MTNDNASRTGLRYFQQHRYRARLTSDLMRMRRDGRVRAHLPCGELLVLELNRAGGKKVAFRMTPDWPFAPSTFVDGDNVVHQCDHADPAQPLHECALALFERLDAPPFATIFADAREQWAGEISLRS